MHYFPLHCLEVKTVVRAGISSTIPSMAAWYDSRFWQKRPGYEVWPVTRTNELKKIQNYPPYHVISFTLIRGIQHISFFSPTLLQKCALTPQSIVKRLVHPICLWPELLHLFHWILCFLLIKQNYHKNDNLWLKSIFSSSFSLNRNKIVLGEELEEN